MPCVKVRAQTTQVSELPAAARLKLESQHGVSIYFGTTYSSYVSTLKTDISSLDPNQTMCYYIQYGEKYSECLHIALKKRYDKCQKAHDTGYTRVG
jgi:hypothetical protein